MGFGSPHRIRSRSFQSCRHNFSARYGEQQLEGERSTAAFILVFQFAGTI